MDTSKIKRWIDQPAAPFSDGVALYNFFGSNEELKRILSRGESTVTKKILRTKLLELWDQLKTQNIAPIREPLQRTPVKQREPVTEDFALLTNSKVLKIDVNALPTVLKEKWLRKATLFQETDFWEKRLDLLETDDERLRAATIIVRNRKEMHQIWKQCEHWQQNHELLEKETMNLPQTEVEVYKELQLLPSRISKAKKKNQSDKISVLEERKKLLKIKLQSFKDAVQK